MIGKPFVLTHKVAIVNYIPEVKIIAQPKKKRNVSRKKRK